MVRAFVGAVIGTFAAFTGAFFLRRHGGGEGFPHWSLDERWSVGRENCAAEGKGFGEESLYNFGMCGWQAAPTPKIIRCVRRRRARFVPFVKGQHGVAGASIWLENAPALFGARRCEPIFDAAPKMLSGPLSGPLVEMLLGMQMGHYYLFPQFKTTEGTLTLGYLYIYFHSTADD
jgi:hypothetical protein